MQSSIPFKILSGWSDANGIARFSDTGIVIEIESSFFIFFKDTKKTTLVLADILDARFRKGLIKSWGQIEIRLNSLDKLRQLPNQDSKIILKLQPEDFKRARSEVEKLMQNLTEHRESMPPPRTPVRSIFDEDE